MAQIHPLEVSAGVLFSRAKDGHASQFGHVPLAAKKLAVKQDFPNTSTAGYEQNMQTLVRKQLSISAGL